MSAGTSAVYQECLFEYPIQKVYILVIVQEQMLMLNINRLPFVQIHLHSCRLGSEKGGVVGDATFSTKHVMIAFLIQLVPSEAGLIGKKVPIHRLQ